MTIYLLGHKHITDHHNPQKYNGNSWGYEGNIHWVCLRLLYIISLRIFNRSGRVHIMFVTSLWFFCPRYGRLSVLSLQPTSWSGVTNQHP